MASDRRLKGPIGELLLSQGRHNMRPSHLHMMVEAPGYHKLVTALYPEGGKYIESDSVFGVKKSLVAVCVAFLQELSGRLRSLGIEIGTSRR